MTWSPGNTSPAMRIFSKTGLAAHSEASLSGERGMWPVVFTYMSFLTAFPDSHIPASSGVEWPRRCWRKPELCEPCLDGDSSEPDRLRLLDEVRPEP